MTKPAPGLPWFYLALDILGSLLVILGVLALTGIDFGHPVLREMGLIFICFGVLLMIPIAVWAIRRANRR